MAGIKDGVGNIERNRPRCGWQINQEEKMNDCLGELAEMELQGVSQ